MVNQKNISTFAARIFKEKQMDVFKDYKITFSGLALGHHTFEFQIDDKFFERFENSRIQQAKISLIVEMLKQETMLQLQLHFTGHAQIICDRCLDSFAYPLDFNELLIVKFGQEMHEESEDVLVLNENDHELSLAQYIYEYISLSLPMQLIHPDNEDGESGCNSEFLDNFKDEEEIDYTEEKMDPRWDALKKLIKE